MQESSRKFRCKALQSTHLLRVWGNPSLPLPIFSIQCSEAVGHQCILRNLGHHIPLVQHIFNSAARPALFQTYIPPFIHSSTRFSSPCPKVSVQSQKGVGIIRAESLGVISAPRLCGPSLPCMDVLCTFRDVLSG